MFECSIGKLRQPTETQNCAFVTLRRTGQRILAAPVLEAVDGRRQVVKEEQKSKPEGRTVANKNIQSGNNLWPANRANRLDRLQNSSNKS